MHVLKLPPYSLNLGLYKMLSNCVDFEVPTITPSWCNQWWLMTSIDFLLKVLMWFRNECAMQTLWCVGFIPWWNFVFGFYPFVNYTTLKKLSNLFLSNLRVDKPNCIYSMLFIVGNSMWSKWQVWVLQFPPSLITIKVLNTRGAMLMIFSANFI
jgi:hypothetical protein